MDPNQWKTSIDLGTIASALLIIAVALFLWVNYKTSKKSKSRR